MARAARDWSNLRLKDRIEPGVRVLFVGINPGVRSALTGHHFAGYSNRFWKLLWDARLVPEPITFEDDDRLPELGFGITNLIARATPGINDLRPAEYVDGWKVLERKIKRFHPEVVAMVGVTVFRALAPLITARGAPPPLARRLPASLGPLDPARRKVRAAGAPGSVLGLQPIAVHGSKLFVLPNPSGRNANFSYAEMLAAFRRLKRAL